MNKVLPASQLREGLELVLSLHRSAEALQRSHEALISFVSKCPDVAVDDIADQWHISRAYGELVARGAGFKEFLVCLAEDT